MIFGKKIASSGLETNIRIHGYSNYLYSLYLGNKFLFWQHSSAELQCTAKLFVIDIAYVFILVVFFLQEYATSVARKFLGRAMDVMQWTSFSTSSALFVQSVVGCSGFEIVLVSSSLTHFGDTTLI